VTTLQTLDSHAAIADVQRIVESLHEMAGTGLKCLKIQEGHEGRMKVLQGAIKILEDEQKKTAKELSGQQETLAALRIVVSAEQEKHKEQLASFQAELSEAKSTIAEAQRLKKEFADLRAKYADLPAAAGKSPAAS